jgi:hypothetical protein
MKDSHGERSAPGRIPVLSPVLHCIAMTALVYLRSSFGLTLFRPRSIFFAFSFAVGVLDYIAWNEPDIWREYRAACIFSAGAVTLYWLHFGITFFRELYRKSERDDYSGTSHALRLLRMLGFSGPKAEMNLHLWIEPAIVLFTALALRVVFSERHLSAWLILVAPCMTLKEGLNYWTEIRRGKIAKDLNEEAEERGNELGGGKATTEAPQAARVGKQTMKRTVVLSAEEERALRFAEALGITEPYDLEEAEANFHNLIRQHHPDAHDNSPESNRRSSDLNEAIEFFRKKLAG